MSLLPLPFPLPLFLTDLIARAGQASTQMLHVLPRHFSLSNCTEESSAMLMASTGHNATQLPQLKHLLLSTSMSLGTVTITVWTVSSPVITILFAVLLGLGIFKIAGYILQMIP